MRAKKEPRPHGIDSLPITIYEERSFLHPFFISLHKHYLMNYSKAIFLVTLVVFLVTVLTTTYYGLRTVIKYRSLKIGFAVTLLLIVMYTLSIPNLIVSIDVLSMHTTLSHSGTMAARIREAILQNEFCSYFNIFLTKLTR